MALVELTARDYEQVRSDPHGFLLLTGHEEPADLITKQSERFTLVRKTGAGARVAGAFDPRGGG